MEQNSALTLTKLAYFGRLTVKYGIIGLVLLMVGRTFFMALSSYWIATHPPAPPPPTMGFGYLPTLRFPTKSAGDKPTTYQLQTPTGGFPRFGDRAKVFLETKSSLSLLADQRVKQIANAFGFSSLPVVLNDRTYRWTKSLPLQTTLDMDLQNTNFSLTTNYLSQPNLFSQKNLPAASDAVNTVESFIISGFPLPSELATSSGKVTYLKSFGGDVTPAVSFSDADLLQIDVMRTPIDGQRPTFTPDGTKGIIHAIISGGLTGKDQIVELEYKYHEVNRSVFETYPLRTPDSAWKILQAGEGYIAQKGTSSTAVVRDVILAYYDDFNEQDYLQPIYVFVGDGGFLGYVPALDPRIYQSAKVGQ